MARADMLTGLVLFALAVAVLYGAWTMDRLEIRQVHPLSVPGLLPGLLGIALAICSVILLAQAAGARRGAAATAVADETDAGNSVRNLGLAAALCLTYALGLVGRLPFWLATALFVAGFILVFEWRDASSRRERLAGLAWAIGIGLCTGLAVAYTFSKLFLVRLP
jgi:putative tricarboxylic transport membrane protein